MKNALICCLFLIVGICVGVYLYKPKPKPLPPKPTINANYDICYEESIVWKTVLEGGVPVRKRDTIRQPYYCNQFVVRFDPGGNKAAAINVLVNEYQLKYIESCMCDEIELWGVEAGTVINPEQLDKLHDSMVDLNGDGFETSFNIISELPAIQGNPEVGVIDSLIAPNPGNNKVVVAVIDSGIDNENGELEALKWVNVQETVNQNDQDGNCLNDDVEGYDFANDQTLVDDNHGHGSHVAGIIARDSSSVVDNLDLKIMDLKVFDGSQGTLFDLVCAISYATQKHVDIMNLSLGFYSKYPPIVLQDVLSNTLDAGILVVTSAGNDGLDNDNIDLRHYPSDFSSVFGNIISVAALDFVRDSYWENSNYGKNMVNIAAEGENVLSYYYNQLIVKNSGTSMATAVVSQIAANVLAQNPALTHLQIRDCIYQHTDNNTFTHTFKEIDRDGKVVSIPILPDCN